MTQKVSLEMAVNDAIMGTHQISNPLERARRAGDLIEYLQRVVNSDLAPIRRRAVAEAIQWPNMSMAKVAVELGLSKSAVAKLAAPDIRNAVADDLRARLAKGFNPPPLQG